MFNHLDETGTNNSSGNNDFIVKFDENLEPEWVYQPEALGVLRRLRSTEEIGDYLVIHWFFQDIELTINDQDYPYQERVHSVIILDRHTGEEVTHLYDADQNNFSAFVNYVEYLGNNKVRILYWTRDNLGLFGLGNDLGHDVGLIFLEGELSFLTDILETESQDLGVSIYGNPVARQLNIRYEGEEKVQGQIYNMNGQQVISPFSIDRNIREVDVQELPAGSYVLMVMDTRNNRQTQIFIKE